MNVAACIRMYMLHVPPVYILLIQQLSCFFPVGSPFSPWGPHYSGENGDPGIPIFMGSPKFYDTGVQTIEHVLATLCHLMNTIATSMA